MVVVSKSGSRSTCYRPIQKLVHFEINYKSKESAGEEKHDANNEEMEPDKKHKSDIKSTIKAAIEGQYTRRSRDKYG